MRRAQALVDLAVLALPSKLHRLHDEQPDADDDQRDECEPRDRS
jgi:hypothetical protein